MAILKLYRSCQATWWGKPQLKPVYGHRQASWIELFFDLMFVASISVLNHQAFAQTNALTSVELASYVLGFLSIWLIWMSMTYFSNWFEVNSVRHRLIIFLNIISIGFLTFGITTDLSGAINLQAFIYLGGFILSRTLLLVTWQSAQAPVHLPSIQKLIRNVRLVYCASIGLGIVIGIILIGFQLPIIVSLPIWALSVFGELICLPLLFAHSQKAVTTLHREHLTERFGLFTMLLLGEMIIGALSGFRHQAISLGSIVEMGLGLVIIFGYWWVYYDQVLATAFRETGRSRLIWTTIHFIFALTTMSLSANFEYLTSHFIIDAVTKQWLVGSLFVFFVTITILHYTLDYEHFYAQLAQQQGGQTQLDAQSLHRYMRFVIITRMISLIVLLGLWLMPIDSMVVILGIIALLLAANAFAGLTVWLQASHHLASQTE